MTWITDLDQALHESVFEDLTLCCQNLKVFCFGRIDTNEDEVIESLLDLSRAIIQASESTLEELEFWPFVEAEDVERYFELFKELLSFRGPALKSLDLTGNNALTVE